MEAILGSLSNRLTPTFAGAAGGMAWTPVLAHKTSRAPGQLPRREVPQYMIRDGAGIHSTADWRNPPRGSKDSFKDLRHSLCKRIMQIDLPRRLLAHVECKSKERLYSLEEKSAFAEDMEAFMAAKIDPQHRAPLTYGPQSYVWHWISESQVVSEDKDTGLVPSLANGAFTGFDTVIAPSGIWPLAASGRWPHHPAAGRIWPEHASVRLSLIHI